MVDLEEKYTLSGTVDGDNIITVGDNNVDEINGLKVEVVEELTDNYYIVEQPYGKLKFKVHESKLR
jgi:hypothetical protein